MKKKNVKAIEYYLRRVVTGAGDKGAKGVGGQPKYKHEYTLN